MDCVKSVITSFKVSSLRLCGLLCSGDNMFLGLPSVFWPSVVGLYFCMLFVNTCFTWRDISLLSSRILVKLAANIYHVRGNCWKGFQDQRASQEHRWNTLFWQIDFHQFMALRLSFIWWWHTDRRCGIEAYMFISSADSCLATIDCKFLFLKIFLLVCDYRLAYSGIIAYLCIY